MTVGGGKKKEKKRISTRQGTLPGKAAGVSIKGNGMRVRERIQRQMLE